MKRPRRFSTIAPEIHSDAGRDLHRAGGMNDRQIRQPALVTVLRGPERDRWLRWLRDCERQSVSPNRARVGSDV